MEYISGEPEPGVSVEQVQDECRLREQVTLESSLERRGWKVLRFSSTCGQVLEIQQFLWTGSRDSAVPVDSF